MWIGKWDDYICQMPFSSLEEAAGLGPHQLPNAHLIAASPNLLGIAKDVLDWMEAIGIPDCVIPGWAAMAHGLRAAIAKATGKAA